VIVAGVATVALLPLPMPAAGARYTALGNKCSEAARVAPVT
jgi:hypothetical protein